MSAKTIFIFCAQVLLIQSIYTQCINRAYDPAPYSCAGPALPGYAASAYGPLAYDGLSPFAYDGVVGRGLYGEVYPGIDYSPTSGGSFLVSSSSSLPPTGISIVSENAYEGILAVSGELPFVGTTAVDGVVPSSGAGAIDHACGNGLNAMSALSPTSTPASVATGLAGPYNMAGPYAAGLAAPALTANAFAAPAFTSPNLAARNMAFDGYFDGYPYDGIGYAGPYDGIEFTATSGGALPVSSLSSAAPVGLSVASETMYEGPLACVGELPFVGTVYAEGVLPTAGSGAVNHACGNGVNAMASDSAAFGPGYPGAPYASALAPGFAGAPYGAAMAPGFGRAFRGCGCGL